MKPPFRPRTLAPIPEERRADVEKARAMWREFYREHPEAWKERCKIERDTYENMVQQYVAQHGFRPDNDKLEGWDPAAYDQP